MLYCLELRDLLIGQLSIPHFLCLYLNLTADRIDLGLQIGESLLEELVGPALVCTLTKRIRSHRGSFGQRVC